MLKRSLSSIYTYTYTPRSMSAIIQINQKLRDTDIFKVIKRDIERNSDVVSLSVIVIV